MRLTQADILALAVPHELAPGRYVVIEIRDNGHGIAPAQLARLFEPFFTTKRVGRGLGLPVAQGIARIHGGALVHAPSRGDGATFRLLLPS